MFDDDDVINRVKQENDIFEVISEYVRLKKVGRNYVGLCPFHHEKTPSFTVSTDKQLYKCFGCGESGNVFSFIMKIKNVPFQDSLKILAENKNIDLEFNKSGKNNRYTLETINKEAAKFFYNNLKSNKEALNYLKNRGIEAKTFVHFGLGYADDRLANFLNHMKMNKVKEEDLLILGLMEKSSKGDMYNRFKNRVMFPIFNVQGAIIGFGGRVLDNSNPKYLNSKESVLFKKGSNLYGLNFALKKGIKDNTIIVVEGYMDVISLHQRGITNAVAALGTSFTLSQARLIKRYANKIVLCFDTDDAGVKAAKRSMAILEYINDLEVKIITLPNRKDPDEYIKEKGKDDFLKLVNDAYNIIDFQIALEKKGKDLTKKDQIIKYVESALSIINEVSPVMKDVYIKKLSEETKISELSIRESLLRKKQKLDNNDATSNSINAFIYPNDTGHKMNFKERVLLKIFIENKDIRNSFIDHINEDDFFVSTHKAIYKFIKEKKDDENMQKILEIECTKNDILKEYLCIMDSDYNYDINNIELFINSIVYELRKCKLEDLMKKAMEDINILESEGKIEEVYTLLNRVQKIKIQIRDLEIDESGDSIEG
ncbi:MAG: DNA primase [Oscillospiraceae bacterium]|nr:DNA primase [Oscillospiraceae bacterium]